MSTTQYDCGQVKCEVGRAIPEVRMALNRLDEIITKYNSLVDKLGDKLSYIVSIPLATADNTEVESSYSAPLAQEIDALRLRVRDITTELESLYSRLEI